MSSQALISALLREVDGWSAREACGQAWIELPLPSLRGAIEVPLRRPFGVGRAACDRARWRGYDGATRELSTVELLGRLVAEPTLASALGLDQGATLDHFVARVRASVANLEATLDARVDELEQLITGPLDFIGAEQGLLLGHSVHPAPRLREGLSDASDASLIAELRGRTPLFMWAIARERLFIGGGEAAPSLLAQLIADEPVWAERAAALGPELVLLPLHPLQHRSLLAHGDTQSGLARGELRPLGPLGRAWSVTSSQRTLHAPWSRWMLKFSLPLRLTNSLRSLSLDELERGLVLGRVLEQTDAAELERRYPSFRILREPAYFGLRGDSRAPLQFGFVALRENPFSHATAPVEMLATLLQDHPRTGKSRLALRLEQAAARAGRRPLELVERWFEAFLTNVLEPIVAAQAEHGLLLSAHQQNLVLGFDEQGELTGLSPTRAYFRDGQGTAYSELALRRFGERVPGLERASFRSPTAERVWSYSVVINGVFNVIASLAMVPGVAQSLLLEQLRARLERLREQAPADPRALDYLLDSPTLWTKANLRCFASGVDEVALRDPMTIYRPMPNRLARAEQPEPVALIEAWARVGGFAIADASVELHDAGPTEQRGCLRVAEHQRRFTLSLSSAKGRARLAWLDPASPNEHDLVVDHLFSTRPALRHIDHLGSPIVRESFYQRPTPFHHRAERLPLGSTERILSGGIEHPRRPIEAAELLYRRHCPQIAQTFSLHRFDLDRDFDRFCRWMNDPVVAAFWEQAWPRERLREYIEARLADPHMLPTIGWFDDRPFAYFEIYWAKEDRLGPYYAADDYDRGFHMAVGEPEVRHRGFGRQWFLSMAHFLFLDDPRTQRLVGEPRIDQARVRSWSTSTAWQEWGEIQFPHKRAVLMVLTRERFFSSFEG